MFYPCYKNKKNPRQNLSEGEFDTKDQVLSTYVSPESVCDIVLLVGSLKCSQLLLIYFILQLVQTIEHNRGRLASRNCDISASFIVLETGAQLLLYNTRVQNIFGCGNFESM